MLLNTCILCHLSTAFTGFGFTSKNVYDTISSYFAVILWSFQKLRPLNSLSFTIGFYSLTIEYGSM